MPALNCGRMAWSKQSSRIPLSGQFVREFPVIFHVPGTGSRYRYCSGISLSLFRYYLTVRYRSAHVDVPYMYSCTYGTVPTYWYCTVPTVPVATMNSSTCTVVAVRVMSDDPSSGGMRLRDWRECSERVHEILIVLY